MREEGLRGVYRGLFPVVSSLLSCSLALLKVLSADDASRSVCSARLLSEAYTKRKLGANSAVRFTTYTTLKQFVLSNARPGQTLSTGVTFGIGAIAGLVTVYTTMPLEYVAASSVDSAPHASHNCWQRH